ncbi:MAG: helix-turn-helix transcriptional regulator [Phycisphaerae bacterium]|nr:helix-turn-helix transcriptional regulator [Phycisphaerae bacterium]
MIRFVRTKKDEIFPQALMVQHDNRHFYPVLQHAAIYQDYPVGEKSTFREHIHNLYHLVLYTYGHGSYLKNSQKHPVQQGSLVIISPGQPHDFVTCQSTTIYSEITFSYETKDGQVLEVPFNDLLALHTAVNISLFDHIILSEHNMGFLNDLFMNLTKTALDSTLTSPYHVHRILAQILDFIVQISGGKPNQTSLTELASYAKNYIDMHYTETISVDQLADKVNMSRSHFFRVFKKQLDITPQAYQQNLRLQAAKTLLRVTSLSSKQVASRVGYDNIYLFQRLFKKHIGMTPIQYRKSQHP